MAGTTEKVSPVKLLYAVDAELCKRSLKEFVKTFWSEIIGNELIWNWHMDVLCDEIQQVDRRVFSRTKKEYDLILNVPPGTTKTTIASIMATAWDFANMPEIRVMIVSFSDDAVKDMADKVRLVMNSEKYKRLFPNVQIRSDLNNKHEFKTSANGHFYVASIGGTITSKHFDKINIDDPIDPRKVESRAALLTVNKTFFDRTITTRKVDKAVTPIVLTMQRLAVKDPTGHLLDKKADKIKHIVLPATSEFEVKPAELKKNYVNGLLDPVRLDSDVLIEQRKDLGEAEFAGQFGQAPVPPGGNIIKTDWIQTVDPMDLPLEATMQPFNFFADTAYTSEERNDPNGLLTTFMYQGVIYIADWWSRHLELHDCVNAIHGTAKTYGDYRSRVIIENKASGKSINQELKRLFSGKLNLLLMNVKGKKVDRLLAFQAAFQAGKVKLLKGHWNESLLAELTGFPNMPHDEAVDCLTMALSFYLKPQQAERRVFSG